MKTGSIQNTRNTPPLQLPILRKGKKEYPITVSELVCLNFFKPFIESVLQDTSTGIVYLGISNQMQTDFRTFVKNHKFALADEETDISRNVKSIWIKIHRAYPAPKNIYGMNFDPTRSLPGIFISREQASILIGIANLAPQDLLRAHQRP